YLFPEPARHPCTSPLSGSCPAALADPSRCSMVGSREVARHIAARKREKSFMICRLLAVAALAAALIIPRPASAEANAVRVAKQAIMLQMAAAKEWGDAKYNALDHLTVSMSHPDATAAMLGGSSEITANFSSAPFQYRQMKNPNIHRILTSTELFDEPLS